MQSLEELWMHPKRRVVLRRILWPLGAAVVLLWIGSYLAPIRVAVLPNGDTAIAIASKDGEFGLVEMDWTGASSEPGLNYWQTAAAIGLVFAATFCGSSGRQAADVGGSFPIFATR